MVTAAKLRPAMDIERRLPQRSAISTARTGTDVAHRPRPQQRSPLRQSEACPRSGLRALAQDDDQRAARLPPSRLPPSSTNAVVRARHDNALARRPAQERSTTDTASPPTDRARDTATARRRPGRRPVSQGTITSRFPRRSVRCHAASIWLSGMVTRLKSSSRSRAHWTTWAYARPIVSPSMPLVAP